MIHWGHLGHIFLSNHVIVQLTSVLVPLYFFNFGIQPRYDWVKLEKYIFLKYLYGLEFS